MYARTTLATPSICTKPTGNYIHSPRLERGVRVGQELLKVCLEPGTRLRSRLKGIGLAAVEVVPRRAGVAGSIALASGLDPHEGILQLETCVGRGPEAKPSANGVTPVAPRRLASGLLAGPALVCDEVGVEAGR